MRPLLSTLTENSIGHSIESNSHCRNRALVYDRSTMTQIIGRKILRFDEVQSTNDLAREFGEAGEPEGLVITAESQRAGRGRLGRKWIVPHGTSIQLSILLRPSLPIAKVQQITQFAGLAVARTLRADYNLAPTLKWPNDVLLNGKKWSGILCETSIEGIAIAYVILGIGLNVNYSMREFPDLLPYATTISDELGHSVNRGGLERALLANLDDYYARWRQGSNFLDEYRGALDMLGAAVRVATPTGVIQGIAQDIDADGALILEHDQTSVRLLAGDVTILK